MSLVSLWTGTERGSGVSLSCSPWGKLQVGFSPAFLPLFSCLGCHYPLCLPGLSVPSGECTAGFYCKGGAVLPNPTDDVTGNICPAGTYCSKYPASVRDSNSLAFNIWNPDGWFWECDSQLAGLWSGCPESQILLLVAYPYSESRDIFVSLLEAVCLQDVFSFTSITHYKIKLISVLFHVVLLHFWAKIRFHCCPFHAALHSFSPQMQQYLFFHYSFISALFLFSQLQGQQNPSCAQLAPSPACQGGEHFLSACLVPLASTVRVLVSVPPLESAGKVREFTECSAPFVQELPACFWLLSFFMGESLELTAWFSSLDQRIICGSVWKDC